MLLTGSATAVGEKPTRGQVVRSLLARSRLLEDVRFRVPVEAYRRYLREVLGIAPAAPPPVACVATDGRYHLTLDGAGTGDLAARVTYHVLHPRSAGDLPVLTAKRTWTNVTVNGKPASLATRNGWLRLRPRDVGPYVVAARTSWRADPGRGGTLAFDVARTTRTVLRFDSPSRWQVTADGSPEEIAGQAQRGTHGQLCLTPRTRVNVTCAHPIALEPRPPRYELRGATAWNLDTGRQQVAASMRVGIFGGRTDRLSLSLPPAARRVSIRGPDVREARAAGGEATVFLRGAVTGQTRLDVTYELPLTPGSIQRLDPIRIRDGHWSGGTVVVTNTTGDSEILEHTATGLREIHPADLPGEARRILAGKIVLAYSITARDFAVAIDAVRLGEFALRESIADLANYQVLLRPDGQVLCKVDYEVRNRGRQFLRVSLPDDALVLSARVNDRSQPLTPVPGRAGEVLLPLVRSRASVKGLVSFPVQIVMLWRGPALRSTRTAELPLPRIDLPVAYGWCELYAPRGMDVQKWSGPLRSVARYSSETAVASLSYGRGELAEGYALTDRPTVEARPTGEGDRPTPTPEPVLKRLFRGLDNFSPLAMGVKAPPPAPRPATQPGPQPDSPAVTPTTVVPVRGGTLVLGGQIMLSRNYYRAGRDYYDKGDYKNASDSLTKAIRLAPKNPEAANAHRLLANIKMVRGDLAASSRQEKALGRQVKKEISSLNVHLEQQQQELIEQAGQATREGRQAQAEASYRAAVSLGEKLIARGAEEREQGVRLREATKTLERLRKDQQAQATRLRQWFEKTKAAGEYAEALKVGKALQKLDKQEGPEGDLRDELEKLAVESVRQKTSRGSARFGLGPKSTKRHAEPADPGKSRPADRPETLTRRVYDVRDLLVDVPNFKAPRIELGEADPKRRTGGGGKAGGIFEDAPRRGRDGEKDAKNAQAGLTDDFTKLVRRALGKKSTDEDAGVQVVNGQLVVSASADDQKLTRGLIDTLRKVRGPQVELRGNIAEQRAAGLVTTAGDLDADASVNGTLTARTSPGTFSYARTDARPEGESRRTELAKNPEFQDFLERNYDWQLEHRKGDGGWGFAGAGSLSGKVPAIVPRDDDKDRAAKQVHDKALMNLGQKVAVNSMNVNLGTAATRQLGVRFVRGRNGLRYTVVDEAQLRTLREIEGQRSGPGRGVPANPRLQETIVGTDALLASGQRANVTFAAEGGNTIDLYQNPIALPHEKYILIDNGSFLTAVKAGEMQHWTRRAKSVEFAEVPQDLDVPRVGRLVKFEKTLIKPADELTIRARYTWTGKE